MQSAIVDDSVFVLILFRQITQRLNRKYCLRYRQRRDQIACKINSRDVYLQQMISMSLVCLI